MKIGGPIYSWFIQFNLQFYLIRTSYSFAIHSSNAAQSYTRGSQDSSSSPAPDHDEPLVKSKTSFCGDRFQPTIFTSGDDPNIGGPGVLMRDLDYTNTYKPHFYFFYENGQDEHPWKYTLLQPGGEVFISVCPTFEGRIVRGDPTYNLNRTIQTNLGTWVELSWEGPPTKRSWGDVSLLEGYDGAALLMPTDGSGVLTGFTADILMGAPSSALAYKADGGVALAKTVGDGANMIARAYELGLLNPMTQAFILEAYKPVVLSSNGRWDLTLYPGTY